MKSLSYILFFTCIASLCTGYAQVPTFVPEEWSGTATLVYTVKEGSQFFTELRHEARISKGKGTATTNYRMRIQNKESKEEGSSQGSGATSLHIDFDPPYYSFLIPTPASAGSATRTIKNGGSSTYTIGEEESLIMVDDQKLGENANILSGKFEEGGTKDGASSMLTITWNFYSGAVDGELIVGSTEYATWKPEPGADEDISGSRLTFKLDLVDKNGDPSRLNAKYFELELKNTSKELGLAINYPVNPSAPLHDIRFIEIPGAIISNQGQFMRLTAVESGDDTAVLGSFDGGGYTTLSVYAILQDGRRIEGHLEKPGGITGIDIPKRKAGSRIALSWLLQHGNPADDDDNEISTGTSHNGDGLSTYEEYRGIRTFGKWQRLNPRRKELAVKLKTGELTDFTSGLATLSEAADIVVIPLFENELGDDRILNKNSSETGRHIQHGMVLINGTIAKAVGENRPKDKKEKTPKDSELIVVDIGQLKAGYKKQIIDAGGIALSFTVWDLIESTVAHELAHGIGIDHHGASSDEPAFDIEERKNPGYEVYSNDATASAIVERPYPLRGKVGIPGCDASGDLNCMMAYARFYNWVVHKGPDVIKYYAIPLLADGKTLCTSGIGTGINENNKYFGNATWGNCMGKIKVRDE